MGVPVEVISLHGSEKSLKMQVLDSRDHMYVVAVKLLDDSTSESEDANPEFDPFAKGGLKDGAASMKEQEIGYYTIQDALGVGQCGMVRKGVHRTSEAKVAVKTLTFSVNRNLECGLCSLDCSGRGVSNGAGFFLRNFGLALCSGRILV